MRGLLLTGSLARGTARADSDLDVLVVTGEQATDDGWRSAARPLRARPQDGADDPERIGIREALAFGKALYDIRTALGLSVAELAMRAAMTDDDIERIEEGGTEPTIPLLRRLDAALNADVRLTGGHDLGSVWFETHAALPKPRRREHRHSACTRRNRRSALLICYYDRVPNFRQIWMICLRRNRAWLKLGCVSERHLVTIEVNGRPADLRHGA